MSDNELTGDGRNYLTSFLVRRGVPHVPHESAASLVGRTAAEIDKLEDGVRFLVELLEMEFDYRPDDGDDRWYELKRRYCK